MWLLKTLVLGALVLLPCPVLAEQAQVLGRYVHQRWLEGAGTPVPVASMAQGRDGFLWLATGDGLFRFDGIRFERLDAQAPLRNDPPSTLLMTRSGDVWISFEASHRFAFYSRGTLRLVDGPPAPNRVVGMVEGQDGAIWALTSNYNAEVLRLKDGVWQTFNARHGLPQSNAAHMVMGRDGTLWVAGSEGVAWLPPGAETFRFLRTESSARVSQDPHGTIWLSDKTGTYPIAMVGKPGVPADTTTRFPTGDLDIRGAPVFDRHGNLWVATRYKGLKLFPRSNPYGIEDEALPESFTSQQGLSSDVTNGLFEDREGNLWVSTEGGLDRLRAATLVRDPTFSSPARFGDKLLAGADGTVYIGQANTIFKVPPHGEPEPIIRDIVEPEAICEAHDGAVWVALRHEILVWSPDGIRERIERPDRKARHNIAYDCAVDATGSFWISAAGGGVHRYREGRWEQVFEGGEDADFYPTTLTTTVAGSVVFQSGDRLLWAKETGLSTTRLHFGDSQLKVLTLQPAGKSLYVAGAFGLTRYVDGKPETAWSPDISPGSRINGLAETPGGDLWLAYPRMLVRMSATELEHAFRNRKLPPPNFALGRADGLTSRPHSHSQRAMVRGGDGRLWIATESGTLWMDPSDIVRDQTIPGVAITALRTEALAYRDPILVRLPPATPKIEIDYAALSFIDQQRVSVRYRLEGFDQDWVYPGQRRQAFYTNLSPGKYRFQVMAANMEGKWNPSPASLEFEIPKTFYQSGWFLLLCMATVLTILFALHRLRIIQAGNRIRARLEERNAERERIARELHDTLLQGVMGLILRFQAVANRMPRDADLGKKLDTALAAADAVVVDARNRVRDLRGADEAADLLATLRRVAGETPFSPPMSVRMLIEGQPRTLHPLVSAETVKIFSEALLNVAHHSRASSVEIAVGFESRQLAIRLRDDGVGIPALVLEAGHKDGHFGLVGMRERAERMGGSLNITSVTSQGTEVTLLIPARLAYGRRSLRKVAWWKRFIGKKRND